MTHDAKSPHSMPPSLMMMHSIAHLSLPYRKTVTGQGLHVRMGGLYSGIMMALGLSRDFRMLSALPCCGRKLATMRSYEH